MAGFDVIDENDFEDDALRSAIKSYKDAMRKWNQDLTIEFLMKTLRAVNENSVVKIARNPVDKNHEWIHGTTLYNVGKIEIDEEHHLTLRIRHDNTEFTVENMIDQIFKLSRKLHGLQGPIMLAIGDKKKVQLTDVYSHSLVKSVYAGLPFDVVLAYFEEDTSPKSKPELESEPEE